jgi:hypothetical protein
MRAYTVIRLINHQKALEIFPNDLGFVIQIQEGKKQVTIIGLYKPALRAYTLRLLATIHFHSFASQPNQ